MWRTGTCLLQTGKTSEACLSWCQHTMVPGGFGDPITILTSWWWVVGPDEGGELQELPTGLTRAVHTLLRKLSQTLLKMLSLLILINKDLAHYFLPCPLNGFPVVKLSVVFFSAVPHGLWDLSSQARDWTWSTAVQVQRPSPWTTRNSEFPKSSF